MSGKPLAIIVNPGNTYSMYDAMADKLGADRAKWEARLGRIPMQGEVVDILSCVTYTTTNLGTFTYYLVESRKTHLQYVVGREAFLLEKNNKNLKHLAVINKIKEISARRKSLGYVW